MNKEELNKIVRSAYLTGMDKGKELVKVADEATKEIDSIVEDFISFVGVEQTTPKTKRKYVLKKKKRKNVRWSKTEEAILLKYASIKSLRQIKNMLKESAHTKRNENAIKQRINYLNRLKKK